MEAYILLFNAILLELILISNMHPVQSFNLNSKKLKNIFKHKYI